MDIDFDDIGVFVNDMGGEHAALDIPQQGQHETAHEPCVRCANGPVRCRWFGSGCFREGAQHRA